MISQLLKEWPEVLFFTAVITVALFV